MKIINAVFTDLDGTLIKTRSGRDFPIHSADWRFIDETIDALEYYVNLGYKIVIVTNQAGIEQGYVVEKVFLHKIETICSALEKELAIPKNSVSYQYCKHSEGYHRKPNPGMAYEAALEYEISLKDSIMFGDFPSDKEFASNAGIGTYKDIEEILITKWND